MRSVTTEATEAERDRLAAIVDLAVDAYRANEAWKSHAAEEVAPDVFALARAMDQADQRFEDAIAAEVARRDG
jgi:hypothetical protein